jgi:hypothetical protein
VAWTGGLNKDLIVYETWGAPRLLVSFRGRKWLRIHAVFAVPALQKLSGTTVLFLCPKRPWIMAQEASHGFFAVLRMADH